MENKKLNLIHDSIRVQYTDMSGVIKIDGHGGPTALYELCKDHNLETNDIFIIGFSIGENTTQGIAKTDEVGCSIYHIPTDEYGSNFDEIASKLRTIDHSIEITKTDITIKYSTLGKYFKRFKFMVTTELINNINSFEIVE